MQTPANKLLPADITAADDALPAPACPVDRLPRRRRNKICIAVIILGGLNFLIYTLVYAGLGGDAHNGGKKLVVGPDGATETVYYVGGHYIRSVDGEDKAVSRSLWIYSYVHSISVLLTSGAMIISMLVLARPDILATMRDGWMSGQTFVTAFGTLVIFVTLAAAVLFTWRLIAHLN